MLANVIVVAGLQKIMVKDLRQYISDRAGYMALNQPLYDSAVYLSNGGHRRIDFFVNPIKTAMGDGHVRTLADTNMEMPGQLPYGREFLIQSISVDFITTAPKAGADAANFYRSGSLELIIGSMRYFALAPLSRFIPKLNPPLAKVFVAGGPYSFGEYPLLLGSNQNFCVSMSWHGEKPPIQHDARIIVNLEGVMFMMTA